MVQPIDSVELAEALAAAGTARSQAELEALIDGVLAAPPGHDPDAWLDLLAPPDAAVLRQQLRALAEARRLRQHTGLPPAERLAALRAELVRQGVDGFVLPLTDEHRSEYVPDCAQRLAWLTGFTGSAGVLVVLGARAVVFVDGRYTVQAAAQLDPTWFERAHLLEEPPSAWLERNLAAGQRVGFDPRLHVKAEVEKLRAACERAGGALAPLDANPVDAIWPDRPAAPIAPLEPLDDRFAGEPVAAKRQRMAAAVRERGAAVAVITALDSIAWLLNLRGGDVPFNPVALGHALLHADGAVELFVDQRKLRPGQSLGNGVSVQPIASFAASLERLGHDRARVLVDPEWTTVGVTDRLRAAGAQIVEGADPCVLAKATKNPVELAGARGAQRRDGAALCRFLAWLDQAAPAGELTESVAAARLDAERARDPLFRGRSFETISAAGPNAALPHYRVTPESDRRLVPGTLYLVDSGGQYLDGTTDVTRTVALGEPSDEMRTRFTLVLKGHIAIDQARFPVGTTGAQLDSFARRALWQAGLDYDHGTGHGVGSYLCVHEGPARLSKSGTVALRPGMILSNEPGYYKDGAYGIRIENLLAVVEEGVPPGGDRPLLGFASLTRAPIDRRLIVADLLTAEERAWLDAYHATVRAELADLLDAAALTWLTAATAPLA
jgi:Xaa-Pro aminopeptidase